MALTLKFLHPIRKLFTLYTSSHTSISNTRQLCYCRFEPVNSLVNRFQHVNYKYPATLLCKLNIQRNYIRNFLLSGSTGSIIGVSIVVGSIIFFPCIAYAIDGHDIWVDDHHVDFFSAPYMDENPPAIWVFVRRFWLPVFFFLTVLFNWDHPIVLATKVILFLLSTKPSPLSVYIFVEQLRHQYIFQAPYFCMIKALYANKVEVQDYKLLCLARVEIGEQKFTLVGILGGWWVLPLSESVFCIKRWSSTRLLRK
ncbi:hypothetical protein CFOL_v3_11441 [Cephalotus follicularis]|uniref:Uncharacterized protein n=1 Tax=Cephalotus follicularis TaxID=3775 RepID=A0A1Q3BJ38_CEPFO|nr:hypothetical protein CFOL_v3_11441 [Cephalotus follicularis]